MKMQDERQVPESQIDGYDEFTGCINSHEDEAFYGVAAEELA